MKTKNEMEVAIKGRKDLAANYTESISNYRLDK